MARQIKRKQRPRAARTGQSIAAQPMVDLGTGPAKSNAGLDPDPDDLYGLEEPLAKPGDVSHKLGNRDAQGTRMSMDQLGNQQ